MPERSFWHDRGRLLPIGYAAVFAGAIIVFNAAWPVVHTDTDLWSHLSAGRRIAETGAIPREAFFSFLTPTRAYLDSSWLFQLLVYQVYARGGYVGLVALRATLFAAIAACVMGLLFAGSRKNTVFSQSLPSMPHRGRGDAWPAFMAVLILIAILPRCLVLLPHLAEYLGILIFLLVLETHQAWAPALPIVALFWGNLHGASYPLLLLICGSYAVERLLVRRGARLDDQAFGLLALSMPAVFMTPLGSTLVDAPFMTRLSNAVSWQHASTFMIKAGGLPPVTAVNLLLGAATLSAAGAGFARKARISHLLLFAGGIVLLSQGKRFYYEMALLSLPLLRAHPPFEFPRWHSRSVAWVAVIALMVSPYVTLVRGMSRRPRYPLSLRGLPHGVTAFLLAHGGDGSVLNLPEVGGYYEWRLYPRFRIAMDMQLHQAFSEEDLLIFSEAFHSADSLGPLLKKYRPEFIAPPIASSQFKDVIRKFPDYVPVFFDQAAVLYASRSRRSDLVARWRLPIDPFEATHLEPEQILDPAGRIGCLPRFLARMLEIDPEDSIARSLASRICAFRNDGTAAAAHAQILIEAYPEANTGRLLLAQALEAAGKNREAIAAYRSAQRWADDPQADSIRSALVRVYERLSLWTEAKRERLLLSAGAPSSPARNN